MLILGYEFNAGGGLGFFFLDKTCNDGASFDIYALTDLNLEFKAERRKGRILEQVTCFMKEKQLFELHSSFKYVNE